MLLDELKLTTFNGNYEYYAKERKKQLEIRKSQYENQQKEIKKTGTDHRKIPWTWSCKIYKTGQE